MYDLRNFTVLGMSHTERDDTWWGDAVSFPFDNSQPSMVVDNGMIGYILLTGLTVEEDSGLIKTLLRKNEARLNVLEENPEWLLNSTQKYEIQLVRGGRGCQRVQHSRRTPPSVQHRELFGLM